MKKVTDYLSDSSDMLDNVKQATISGAVVVQERVKDAVQTGLAKTQEGISAGLDSTQDALRGMQKGSKKYAKNLKKMQKGASKNVKTLQKSASKNMKSLQKGAKENLKNLQQGVGSNMQAAQKNVQQVGNALQSRRAKATRQRSRRKWVFRVGLLAGVVAALLFAPRPGSEMRSQFASFWQRLTAGRAATTPNQKTVMPKPDLVSSNRNR